MLESKMRIGIDIIPYQINRNMGVGRYTYNLIQHLARIDHNNEYVLFGYRKNARDILPNNSNFKYRKLNGLPLFPKLSRDLSRQFSLFKEVSRSKIDLLHLTMEPVPKWFPVKTIFNIYDTIRLKKVPYNNHTFGQELANNIRLYLWKTLAAHATYILTTSENSKKDIHQYMGINPDKIGVTYLGVDPIFKKDWNKENLESLKRSFGIFGEFLLFVGGLGRQKNEERVVTAFKKIKDKGLDLSLIFVSTSDPPKKLKWLISNFNLENDIKFIKSASDNELNNLYNMARVLIFVSLYEGFGLPSLEAMKCGTPVIASNTSSIPEVVGDAAILVNPYNTEDIFEAILKLVLNKELQNHLIQKGYERVKAFSWENTAKKTLIYYHKVLDSSKFS